MPPVPAWHDCRDVIVATLRAALEPQSPTYVGHMRKVAIVRTGSRRAPSTSAPPPTPSTVRGIELLRIEGGKIVEMTAFLEAKLVLAFGLPAIHS